MKRPNPQACAEALELLDHDPVVVDEARGDAIRAALRFCARQPDGFMLLDESTEAIEFNGNMGNLEPQEHQAVFACYRIDNPVGETEDE